MCTLPQAAIACPHESTLLSEIHMSALRALHPCMLHDPEGRDENRDFQDMLDGLTW